MDDALNEIRALENSHDTPIESTYGSVSTNVGILEGFDLAEKTSIVAGLGLRGEETVRPPARLFFGGGVHLLPADKKRSRNPFASTTVAVVPAYIFDFWIDSLPDRDDEDVWTIDNATQVNRVRSIILGPEPFDAPKLVVVADSMYAPSARLFHLGDFTVGRLVFDQCENLSSSFLHRFEASFTWLMPTDTKNVVLPSFAKNIRNRQLVDMLADVPMYVKNLLTLRKKPGAPDEERRPTVISVDCKYAKGFAEAEVAEFSHISCTKEMLARTVAYNMEIGNARHILYENAGVFHAVPFHTDHEIRCVKARIEAATSCVVCFSDFGKTRCVMPCCHNAVCPACIGKWLDIKRVCPCCTRDASPSAIMLIDEDMYDHSQKIKLLLGACADTQGGTVTPKVVLYIAPHYTSERPIVSPNDVDVNADDIYAWAEQAGFRFSGRGASGREALRSFYRDRSNLLVVTDESLFPGALGSLFATALVLLDPFSEMEHAVRNRVIRDCAPKIVYKLDAATTALAVVHTKEKS
jgi:hypothetical protein